MKKIPMSFLQSGKVACPKCNSIVNSVDDDYLSCEVCSIKFPILHNIPILVENPDEYLASWIQQFRNFILNQQTMIQHEQQLANNVNIFPPFGQRLKKSIHARTENLQVIAEVMAPLRDAPFNPLLSNDIKSAGQFASPMYLLRDWGWDTGEPELMCAKIKEIMPEGLIPESILVLGAGGCGESYILHEHYNCPLTVSVEIDPFKLFGASKIINGGEIDLYQILQSNVRNERDHISYWKLRSPGLPSGEFEYVLADAGRLPFSENSFHVLFTPFIIDAIGIDFRNFASHIHRVIEHGGIWANFGVLSFKPEFSYTGEEVLSIVETSGFKILKSGYMKKPHVAPRESCLVQEFDCLYFTAEKNAVI